MSKISETVINTMESEPLGAELFVVEGNRSGPLNAARRSELKAKLKAGELEELEFLAVVFRDGPNANHTRFRGTDLRDFAASYAGVPFLRNHDSGDIGARDGTVISSVLVGSEFHQAVKLTTERGMKDFLEGVIDRFSIGWYFEGVECSVCGGDWMECEHWPGQRYAASGGLRAASRENDSLARSQQPTARSQEGQVCEIVFVGPRGKETSAVNAPAVQGTRVLEQLTSLKAKEQKMGKEAENGIVVEDGRATLATRDVQSGELREGAAQESTAIEPAKPAQVDALAEVAALRAQLDGERIERLIDSSGLTGEGKQVVRLASKGHSPDFTAQLIEAQRKADGARLDNQLVRGIRPVQGGVRGGGAQGVQMMTPLDRVQSAWSWLFGARDEATPVPSMRSIRDIYLAITGDFDWQGRFNPEWAQLAAATTTTLAGMTVNALNKVILMHYENMATYRWYERIVDVVPHDGSTHDVQMVTIDGISNLPTVSEGAAYTEATVGDAKESMVFSKKGHYVGITLETIRKSDIQRIQAIPRALVQGAVRTRSAAVSNIFTQASGTGPTLAQDSTVLFHANHGNVATTAFDAAGWAAARTAIWEQVIPGTAKPLGLWPTFVLVPIELYDDALELFGYGSGDVGKPAVLGTDAGVQTVNPYGESRIGDPRPIPIAVPDWTDATDWAAIVDPRLQPVIQMAYANAPQGGAHAAPEIFEVTDERSGLMFSNDTLPVKIRDWWTVGVSTYVGVAKRNVA